MRRRDSVRWPVSRWWGYWLSAAFGNVAFAVLFMQTLGYSFPGFTGGNNWPSIIGASLLIWAMNFIVLSGFRRAAILNVISSVLNIGTITVALCAIAVSIRGGMFFFEFWGSQEHLGSLLGEVKSTMLVTLLVFIGIEGRSSCAIERARRRRPAWQPFLASSSARYCTSCYPRCPSA